ncbi:MAG: hypothetical protein ACXWG0_09015 [Chthoniobacterales bacterium]
MPLNTRTPAPSPNEKKNSGADQRSLKSSPTGAPQTMPSSSPNESKGKGKRTTRPLLNSPAPTASPKGETKDAPHNLRPERPVYAPNPPDGRLRTTNKSQTSDEAAGAQPAQQSNESQGGEKGDKGEKGKKGKPGEQAPSPAPNQ